ncbi:MAG: hypothetical protein Ct9H90mP2_08090 [Dehalococcoidia bacterium]|nr:MAG: hypothetical protein Ct9H90mP2_08090 [Dehalococcoidia bacterium]
MEYFFGVFLLKSGIHASLAGVLLAQFIPLGSKDQSPLHKLEHSIEPWVNFIILPIFAFANAGVSFSGMKINPFMGSSNDWYYIRFILWKTNWCDVVYLFR